MYVFVAIVNRRRFRRQIERFQVQVSCSANFLPSFPGYLVRTFAFSFRWKGLLTNSFCLNYAPKQQVFRRRSACAHGYVLNVGRKTIDSVANFS